MRTEKLIDTEIAAMIDEGFKKATNIIKKYKSETEKIAKALIEFETLTGEELQAIVDGTFDKKKSEVDLKISVKKKTKKES